MNKSCPPAFPFSQLRGIKPLPKNWEGGKAGGQDLFNKAEPRRGLNGRNHALDEPVEALPGYS